MPNQKSTAQIRRKRSTKPRRGFLGRAVRFFFWSFLVVAVAAVAGAATVNILNETTRAYVGRSALLATENLDGGKNPGIVIDADDTTTIVSVAGSLAAAGSAAVGAGADVDTITKLTAAFIDSNVDADVDGDILITSNSVEDMTWSRSDL